ncbi:MAG TPA: arginine--tRNA ligase, partial [Candidatus Dormibacteraeota bacterium]|nr:arginine--tRNA ligase [Candidatus Dormibacteraeota bacterium]
MPDLEADFAAALRRAASTLGAPEGLEPVVEPSGQPEAGDLSSPVALRLARELRRPPRAIAEDLAAALRAEGLPHVAAVTVTGPGYVNLRLDDATYGPAVVTEALAREGQTVLAAEPAGRGKVVVEHTATNPNKAAHVGHLRNACIGDTVARLLRARGATVEVQNYIDDTGVQVADVLVGLRHLNLPPPGDGDPFDQYCSRVYVEICRRYELEPDLLEERRTTLRAIEAREEPLAGEARRVTGRIVEAHLRTMARLGIRYDLLTWESDILELGFWRHAFDLLQESGLLQHPDTGPLSGCWTLPLSDDEALADPGDDAAPAEVAAKVLVKSDGVATYTAKDIAYHLWKFGLLGLDFHYRLLQPGGPVTSASTPHEDGPAAASFGRAARVVNVIDQRQAAPQRMVREALRRLGHVGQARALHHLAYEVVALSPAAARTLWIDTSDGRAMYALSGRRGIDIGADALIDEAEHQVAAKARDRETAHLLAAAAVRYYLLRFGLNAIITFDFEEALRTTGD